MSVLRFSMKFNPKVLAAVAAAILAAISVLYPEYSALASTISGLLLGKEFLPASTKPENKDEPK